MGRAWSILFVLLALLVTQARAQVQVEWLGQGSARGAGGNEQYQTLRVMVDVPTGGADVSLRDARGGLAVVRRVEAGQGRRVMFPLALVSESALPAGKWPVVVGLRTADGEIREHAVDVVREAIVAPADRRVLTVAASRESAALQQFSHEQVSLRVVVVDEGEIRSAPPLCFAGLDAVSLGSETLEQLTEGRALAFAASGVMLLHEGGIQPPASGVAGVTWARAGSGGDIWVWPGDGLTSPLRPLPVLERTIDRVSATTAEPSKALVHEALWIVPLGLVLAVFARIFVGGSRPLLLGVTLTVLMVGLTVGAVVYMGRTHTGLNEESMQWMLRKAPGGLAQQETYRGLSSLFDQKAVRQVSASTGSTPWLPVMQWPRQWFALEATLQLDELASGSTNREHVLSLQVPGRHVKHVYRRDVAFTAWLPAPGTDVAAWASSTQFNGAGVRWLIGGYVHTGPAVSGSGEIFTAWARKQPNAAELLAWYELRIDAGKTYVLPTPGQSPAVFIELPSK